MHMVTYGDIEIKVCLMLKTLRLLDSGFFVLREDFNELDTLYG